MKLLIDLQGSQTASSRRGIGRYSLALAQAMIRQAGSHEIWIMLNHCFPKSIDELRKTFDGLLPQERIVIWEPSLTASTDMNEHLREEFLASMKPDIVYVSSLFEGFGDPSITSISTRLPTAVTLYDLIPLIYPQKYLQKPEYETWYQRKLASLRRAKLWFAISESSKRDGIDWLQLPEEKIINISAAADEHFRPLPLEQDRIDEIQRRYGISRPFLMYVTAIDPRKNIEKLFAAYALLDLSLREHHQLVIVCSLSPQQMCFLRLQVMKYGLGLDEVVFTSFVPDADLVVLYNLCTALVFPSLYEGFGLPPLEAMNSGAAVIASNSSSLPEVIGRDDALFNPHDEADIAAKLHTVLTNRSFREDLLRHGLEQSKKFSWDASARRALAGLEELYQNNLKEERV